MGVLTQDMRDILASAMLAFVATVRRDGSPSLSPKSLSENIRRDYKVFGA
jgi:predicted pyridoxine 5'-phosphate oxidase superfamily flavin-nucleotide-binding protein